MVSILEIREEEFKKGLEVGVDISRDAFSREPWETMGWPGTLHRTPKIERAKLQIGLIILVLNYATTNDKFIFEGYKSKVVRGTILN